MSSVSALGYLTAVVGWGALHAGDNEFEGRKETTDVSSDPVTGALLRVVLIHHRKWAS